MISFGYIRRVAGVNHWSAIFFAKKTQQLVPEILETPLASLHKMHLATPSRRVERYIPVKLCTPPNTQGSLYRITRSQLHEFNMLVKSRQKFNTNWTLQLSLASCCEWTCGLVEHNMLHTNRWVAANYKDVHLPRSYATDVTGLGTKLSRQLSFSCSWT